MSFKNEYPYYGYDFWFSKDHKKILIKWGSEIFYLDLEILLNVRIIEKNEVQIYPNPAINRLVITFPINNIVIKTTIQDINGKEIFKQDDYIKDFQLTLDISKLLKGSYFLTAKIQHETYIVKFIKGE